MLALSQEITAEIITEICYCLIKISSAVIVTDLEQSIIDASEDIKLTSKRGKGNYVLMSPECYKHICSKYPHFFISEQIDNFYDNVTFVDNVDGINFYVTQVMNFHDTNEYYNMILGYGSKDNDVDSGFVYAPYTMFMPSGPVVNLVTSEPTITVMTRYGIPESAVKPDYYRTLQLPK